MQAKNEKKWEAIAIQEELRQLGYNKWRDKATGISCIEPPVAPISAGEFLMGSDKSRDKQANDNETPQHTVRLDGYEIGKYPVTVAEYALFVEATHCAAPSSWEEQRNRLEHPIVVEAIYRTTSRNWEEQKNRLDHPIVNVSWYDAQTYAKWLSEVTGESWRLPSEAEWEKAARGTDGRIWPWGNEWDASKANTRENGPGTTTPVGSYLQGASPYGVMDMAGNVWEWTHTVYKEYPYDTKDRREDEYSVDNRVLRGGSWVNHSGNARAASRYDNWADFTNYIRGFRLVCAAPAADS